MNLLQHEGLNHHCTITAGVGEQQCAAVLREFFAEQRAKKAAGKN
jgi:tRNA(Arg) A34 adenosine deaminase TadA